MNWLTWMKGKRTYFVAAIAAGLAFADAMGWPMPDWVYLALTAAGLTTIRKAIGNGDNRKDPGIGMFSQGWMLFAMMLLPLAGMGCSFFTPGLDARTATEARNETAWDADSNFRLSESTTHNRKVVMAENSAGAGDVSVEYYESGVPKKVGGATQMLSQVSEPTDVATLMMQRDMLNLQAFAELTATVKELASIAAPIIQQQAALRATNDATNDAERAALRREIAAAVREAMSRPSN